MKILKRFIYLFSGISLLMLVFSNFSNVSASDEYPQNQAWARATPSVVWCGDPESLTTIEVHIINRSDVARVWISEEFDYESDNKIELFDDGTHGDLQTGDNVFTRADVQVPCNPNNFMARGWEFWLGFLRVELTDGQLSGNNYGFMVGLVDQKYKGGFEITQLADDITATAYALFIEDSDNEVINNYPIAEVYCGKSNFVAYQKLYSVLPDQFDFAMVMPGLQIFRPNDLAENVPYNVLVSNQVQHIGMDIMDNTAQFGSAGRLKSVIYSSFASLGVFDHEIAHTWGAAIGQSLGLLSPVYNYEVNQGHWNENADMEGQLGAYYFDSSGAVGHFSYLGNETWTLISNRTVEPYSPLELYTMGLISSEEVPPIHILNTPDTTNTENITAASYTTVTIEDIMAAEGGPRLPSWEEAQKDFTMAFIVTQDIPYNDAAYAFFSLQAYGLTSQEAPTQYSSLAPFYWATGGRATLETRLPLELAVPLLPGMPEPEAEQPTEEEPVAEPPQQEASPTAPETQPQPEQPTELPEPVVTEIPPENQKTPNCSLLPAGLVFIPALLKMRDKKKRQ